MGLTPDAIRLAHAFPIYSFMLLLVGLDAGGTKTALLAHLGAEEVRRFGPGANLQRDGLAASTETVGGLVADLLAELPDVSALRLCVGIAGGGHPEKQAALAESLRDRLESLVSSLEVEVVHDGTLVLDAAFPSPESGLIAIVGTGSVLLARTLEGHTLRAGGWGARLGDPASGTALGKAALAAVADDFDGGEPTVLRLRLAEQFGIHEPDDLVRLIHSSELEFSQLAPIVVDAADVPDWAATRILQREANALAQRAAWLAGRAEDHGGIARRVALWGGLTAATTYREALAEAFLRHLPQWRIVRAATTPEQAALSRAARGAGHSSESGGYSAGS